MILMFFETKLHKKRNSRFFVVTCSLAIMALFLVSGIISSPKVYAFSNGENASIVIGQPDFVSNFKIAPQVNASRFSNPYSVIFDSSGNLWVADASNARVVEFKTPFSNGMSASLALGEPNLTTFVNFGSSLNGSVLQVPEGMAFDSSGNLWVSDYQASRIVEFKPPFSTNENASMVIGAPDLKTPSNGGFGSTTASNLQGPIGLTFDASGNLWVADAGDNRVLEFKTPLSNGESASTVIGQSNFTYDGTNVPGCPPNCSNPTQSSLSDPTDVAFDASGNLWVADRSDRRIMEFTPPFSNNQAASLILGGNCAIFGVVLAANCIGPEDVIQFDHSGMLWVSDSSNGRVMGFPAPFSNGENATVVIGEPDFVTGPSSGILNATQSNLATPEGLAFDASGNIWVADIGLDRVLEFAPGTPGASSSTTSTVSSSTSTTPVGTLSSTSTTTTTSSGGGGGLASGSIIYVGVGVVVVVVIAASVLMLRRR
jgi:sugar lactone lactonase YvrE